MIAVIVILSNDPVFGKIALANAPAGIHQAGICAQAAVVAQALGAGIAKGGPELAPGQVALKFGLLGTDVGCKYQHSQNPNPSYVFQLRHVIAP